MFHFIHKNMANMEFVWLLTVFPFFIYVLINISKVGSIKAFDSNMPAAFQ